MDNNQNQAVNAGAVKQSYSSNKITAIKYLIRSFFLLALFLGGYGLGIVMGTGQLSSMKIMPGVTDQDLMIKPIFTGVSFEGKLKSRSSDAVVLEKDGVEVVINIDKEVSVFDLKSATTPEQNQEGASAGKKFEDIPIGTDLRGSAIIKKDEKTSKTSLFANTFIIN